MWEIGRALLDGDLAVASSMQLKAEEETGFSVAVFRDRIRAMRAGSTAPTGYLDWNEPFLIPRSCGRVLARSGQLCSRMQSLRS